MTANKPEIIGYVPTKDGKLRCGEDGFCLDEYTDQLRDNPAGLKLEPVTLFREYEALQAECEKLRNLAAECAEYLNYSPYTRISHSSVLHRKLIAAAMQGDKA